MSNQFPWFALLGCMAFPSWMPLRAQEAASVVGQGVRGKRVTLRTTLQGAAAGGLVYAGKVVVARTAASRTFVVQADFLFNSLSEPLESHLLAGRRKTQ